MREATADVGVGRGPSRSVELFARADAARRTSGDLVGNIVRTARLRLSLSCSAVPETPGLLRDSVAELASRAGATQPELDSIRTVVSEAVTNVVQHAYDDPPGPLYLDAALIGQRLTILVADDGRGPREPSPRAGLGLGWKTLAQLADRFTVLQRSTGGTELQIQMRLSDVVLRDLPARV